MRIVIPNGVLTMNSGIKIAFSATLTPTKNGWNGYLIYSGELIIGSVRMKINDCIVDETEDLLRFSASRHKSETLLFVLTKKQSGWSGLCQLMYQNGTVSMSATCRCTVNLE